MSFLCNAQEKTVPGTFLTHFLLLFALFADRIKFVKGDMYVLDQAKTTGHTASVTGVQWHPLERDTVLTSSIDGSARLWNLNGKTQFEMLVCDKVFQPKSSKGQRTNVLCVAYHPGGREFAVGTSCGSIQIWNTSRVSGRPERSVFDAHGRGKPINAIVYNYDGSALSSRSSEDDTCKVWDTRIITSSASPLVICKDAATFSEHSSMDFNCNGKIICVGTALRTKTKDGKLRESGGIKFFHVPKSSSSQPNQSEAFLSLDVSGVAGVTVVKWHPKLNEILIGFSDGKTDVLFDPQLSSKGALLPFTKAGRKGDALSELLKSRAPTGSAGVRGQIIAPNAIAIGHGTKRKRGKEEDPSRSRIPEPPAAGLKTGTQSGGGVNFTQFIVDSRMKSSKSIAGKDPREELLKYNEGESYVSKAYEGNTERILADKTVEQEEEELALSKKKRTQK